MLWKTSKIKAWVADGGFRITEDPGASGCRLPFRLDSPNAEPEFFAELEQAKKRAEGLNELAVTKADNERLRAELAQLRGVWPAGDARQDEEPSDTIPAEMDEHPWEGDDDGRGIPTGPRIHSAV